MAWYSNLWTHPIAQEVPEITVSGPVTTVGGAAETARRMRALLALRTGGRGRVLATQAAAVAPEAEV